MKERPIIFSTDMVKAILDGRKTQTRRVIKPQPYLLQPWGLKDMGDGSVWIDKANRIFCPYGQVGNRLWVRETWCSNEWGEFYRANGEYQEGVKRWRSPIHMPHWASRITLEITEVRVERLQEIIAEDAMAEGFTFDGTLVIEPKFLLIDHYAIYWDSFNAKNSWNTNPWVWVIGFKVL